MMKTSSSGKILTKKAAVPDGAEAAASNDVLVMIPENSSSKARLQCPKRRKWRAAYHVAPCLAKRCASP
jgi:hypothetical protein